MKIATFEDLEVWKLAREIRKDISVFAKTLPDSEKYLLFSQIIRSSRSVTANIAEGYGRFHFQENIQFCRHARGSLMEIIDHLTVCTDENYLNEEQFRIFKTQILHCTKVLNGYIAYLKKAKEENTIKKT
ncbi:MAG: four helix bundle protein [Bacteroidales bacterium]